MIRTFTIEFPDDHGPLWMNQDNLLICLLNTCRNTEFKVTDITGDGVSRLPTTGGPSLEYRRSFYREALARGYCSECNEHKVLDPDLIEAMVEELLK